MSKAYDDIDAMYNEMEEQEANDMEFDAIINEKNKEIEALREFVLEIANEKQIYSPNLHGDYICRYCRKTRDGGHSGTCRISRAVRLVSE